MLVDINDLLVEKKPKADSTLNNMRKADLIEYVRCLEYNYNVAISFNAQQAKNIEEFERKAVEKHIDKVVEQLEKNTLPCYDEDTDSELRFIEINKAVEIVKGGGLDAGND